MFGEKLKGKKICLSRWYHLESRLSFCGLLVTSVSFISRECILVTCQQFTGLRSNAKTVAKYN